MILRGKFNTLLSLGLFMLSLGLASKASAIPAFARKYGMACTACHESWPKLNAQGWAFRDNGYQWMAGKDNPIDLRPEYWPIALRDTIGYAYTAQTNVPANPVVLDSNGQPTGVTNAVTVQQGSIGLSGMDLLFAGTLTKDVSFLITIEPFLTNANFTLEYPNPQAVITNPGETGFVESAWVRFDNIAGSPFLNFKIGKGSLDLAFDEHRSFFIFNNAYAIYHYQPVGSFDPFGLGDNTFLAAIEGHNEGSTFRYALTLVQTEANPGSDYFLQAPGVYAHIQGLIFPQRSGVAEVRAGLYGSITSFPTQSKYYDPTGVINAPSGPLIIQPGGIAAPIIPSTGFDHRPAYRAGVDLSAWFGMLATPLNLRLAFQVGSEDKLLFSPGPTGGGQGQDWIWYGQLIELNWTPVLNFTVAARWDGVQNIQTNDPTNVPLTLGQIETEALVFRYQFQIFPRTGQSLHFEFGHSLNWGVGANGTNQDSWNAFGGLDFAF